MNRPGEGGLRLQAPADLRLSDAERDQAAHALGEHFSQGRLTAEEHRERTDRVYSARTHAELPPLFGDLPGGSPVRLAAPPGRTSRGRGPGQTPFRMLRLLLGVALVVVVVTHLVPVLLLLLLLLGAWLLLGSGRRSRRGAPSRC